MVNMNTSASTLTDEDEAKIVTPEASPIDVEAEQVIVFGSSAESGAADDDFELADNERRESEDAPETLVRHDNEQLRILRIVALLFLAVFASVMTIMVYVFIAKSERDKYHDDYDRISKELVKRLLEDCGTYFLGGQTLSYSLQALIQSQVADVYEMPISFNISLTYQSISE
jgi:hypothetical protein